MDCKVICKMNSGYFNGVEVLPDGVCYAPEACPMRQRIVVLEAEKAQKQLVIDNLRQHVSEEWEHAGLAVEVAQAELAQVKRQAEHYISETGLALARAEKAEAELADVKDRYGRLYVDSAQLAADLEAVDRDFEDIKAERDAARAELAGRDALLTNIAEATGPLAQPEKGGE